VGPDHELFVYDDGLYVEGEAQLRRRVQQLLGPRWAPQHSNAAIQWLVQREAVNPLSYDPPLGSRVYTRSRIYDLAAETYEAYTPESAWLARVPWEYDPQAPKPEAILAFLYEVLGSREMVGHFLEIAGYCMLTRNPLRKALLLRGAGRNGKSILLHLLVALLGETNVVALPLQRLGGDDRFSPARLRGKLANICGDIGSQAARDMSLFKQITGGDRIHGEKKGKDGFDFLVGAMMVFSANEFPSSPDTSAAYIDRWLVLEFPNRFAEDAKKENQLRALAENEDEMRGLMKLAVEQAARLVARGNFDPPVEARRAHERFTQAVDSVASFLASDRVIIDPDRRIERSALHMEYQSFCQENGSKPLGRNKFYDRMEKVDGIVREIGHGNVGHFRGVAPTLSVRLNDDPETYPGTYPAEGAANGG
jgi:putative DNA primase/helicase